MLGGNIGRAVTNGWRNGYRTTLVWVFHLMVTSVLLLMTLGVIIWQWTVPNWTNSYTGTIAMSPYFYGHIFYLSIMAARAFPAAFIGTPQMYGLSFVGFIWMNVGNILIAIVTWPGLTDGRAGEVVSNALVDEMVDDPITPYVVLWVIAFFFGTFVTVAAALNDGFSLLNYLASGITDALPWQLRGAMRFARMVTTSEPKFPV